jgi:hypothetical protein
MTMDVVDEIGSPLEAEIATRRDRRRMILVGGALMLLAAVGAAFYLNQSADEQRADDEPGGGNSQTSLAREGRRFRNETVPMLGEINEFMKDQDGEVREFESRRERTNQ